MTDLGMKVMFSGLLLAIASMLFINGKSRDPGFQLARGLLVIAALGGVIMLIGFGELYTLLPPNRLRTAAGRSLASLSRRI